MSVVWFEAFQLLTKITMEVHIIFFISFVLNVAGQTVHKCVRNQKHKFVLFPNSAYTCNWISIEFTIQIETERLFFSFRSLKTHFQTLINFNWPPQVKQWSATKSYSTCFWKIRSVVQSLIFSTFLFGITYV